MRKIVVAVDSQDTIKLGYLGENNFQVVKFDIADWLRDHKNGKAVLLFKVNGMDAPYPCKVEIQDNYANWILTRADLQYGRNGRCQLFYYANGEVVAQSSIFCTDVANSLGEQTTEPPEAFTRWVNNVLTAGLMAENAAESAEQIQQQMNKTLQSAQQTFDAAVRQGLGCIEDAKEQIAQTAEKSVSQLDETANAVNKTVLDTLTEGLHQIDTAQTQAVTAVTEEGDRQAERLDALVPDGYYTKEESDARYAQSENVVSRLCVPFEVSDNIVTCNPVEDSKLNVLAQIEPIQEGEGDPSPDNVRPIRGWDSIDVTRCGKNLFDNNQAIYISQYWSYDDVKNEWRSENTSATYVYVLLHLVPGDYVLSVQVTALNNDSARLTVRTGNNAVIASENFKDVGIASLYWTCETKGTYRIAAGGASIGKVYLKDIMFTRGSIQPEYELYRGETFTIPIGQTVYGGTLDVTTGILTKTHECIQSYAGEDVGDDWMSSTGSLTDGAQVVYRLPQPEIIQLDPVEITVLSGVNTIYADSGDVTVSGYSAPNTIINALADRIAALEQNAIGS